MKATIFCRVSTEGKEQEAIFRQRSEGGPVVKYAQWDGGRLVENKKRGVKTPLFFLTNINSEAGQALDH